MGIAIPGEGPLNVKRTLGSLVPHPAAIGKIMGAHAGITAPRIKLAGGGIADAENISNNMFAPISPTGGIPNADVNFITSPQLGIGKGPPAMTPAKPNQQQNGMQQIAQTGAAANTLVNAGSGIGSIGSSLWNGSTMSAADAAAYNAENGLTAGMGDFASAGDTIGGLGDSLAAFQATPGFGDAIMAAIAAFASGGSIPSRDDGGEVNSLTNMLMRREAGETYHASGLLNSAGPGRTDTINTNVPTGAYVIPADIVSGLGEGNTIAGSAVIDRMFSTSPHGVNAPRIGHGKGPPPMRVAVPEPPPRGEQPGPTVNTAAINGAGGYAKGGKAPDKAPVIVAGGEHVLSPQQIIAKFGSLKKGHATLDHWVVLMRKKIAKEMLALPNPVGSKVKK